MQNEHTHIVVILDRSGSMQSIRQDVIGGFNAFLKQQREEGDGTLTLVQFDSQDPYEVVHRFAPLATMPELSEQTFVPRAATPLLDAVGRGINDLEHTLSGLDEAERPARIVFVIVTDGMENSSHEFGRAQIVQMVREKQDGAGWVFVFLSADLQAIEEAVDTGMQTQRVMSFDKTAEGTIAAWESVSQRVAAFRRSPQSDIAFTDEDRSRQQSEKKRKKK